MTTHDDAAARVPASYYQRDWVLACAGAPRCYSTPLAGTCAGRWTRRARHRAARPGRPARRAAYRLLHPAAPGTSSSSPGGPSTAGSVPSTWPLRRPVAELENRRSAEAERPRALDTGRRSGTSSCCALRPRAPRAGRLHPPPRLRRLVARRCCTTSWSAACRAAVRGRAAAPAGACRLGVGEFAEYERTLRDRNAERWWRNGCAGCLRRSRRRRWAGGSCPAAAAAAGRRRPGPARGGRPRSASGSTRRCWPTVVAVRRREIGDDVVIGVTRARRDRAESHRVIGPLLDHLPVRVDTSRPGSRPASCPSGCTRRTGRRGGGPCRSASSGRPCART